LQCKVANEGQAFAKNRAGVALHVTQPAGLSTPRYGIGISLTSGRDPDMKAHGLGDVGEVKSTQKTKGPIAGGWNELRVICQDKKVTIFYNGEERWSCSRCPVSQGQIGLWSLDGEAYFRDIEIRELPPPADAVRLQGQWSLSLAESEGKRLPINGNDLKNMEIHFGATEFEMIAPAPGPGQELIRVKGTYTLDPVKKEIKLKFKELKTPEPVPCSYLLEGDRLTLDMKAFTLSDPPIPEPPSMRFIYMRKAGK